MPRVVVKRKGKNSFSQTHSISRLYITQLSAIIISIKSQGGNNERIYFNEQCNRYNGSGLPGYLLLNLTGQITYLRNLDKLISQSEPDLRFQIQQENLCPIKMHQAFCRRIWWRKSSSIFRESNYTFPGKPGRSWAGDQRTAPVKVFPDGIVTYEGNGAREFLCASWQIHTICLRTASERSSITRWRIR